MSERITKIERFLTACTALAAGKYAGAEAKISEILASIAASDDLTQLFTAVTQDFDYLSAKKNFLREPQTGAAHGTAYLPAQRSDLLAFVFCLFVEIDSKAVSLGELLSRYFYVDGSTTASFALFAARVVKPFRDIVRDCYPAANAAEQEAKEQREEALEKLLSLLPLEQERLEEFPLRDTDRGSSKIILDGAMNALSAGDCANARAILAGYRYFVGAENELSTQIFEFAQLL